MNLRFLCESSGNVDDEMAEKMTKGRVAGDRFPCTESVAIVSIHTHIVSKEFGRVAGDRYRSYVMAMISFSTDSTQ